MSDLDYLANLQSEDPNAPPLFHVGGYSGLVKMPEIKRQKQFCHLMHAAAPTAIFFANANAGKRAPHTAKAEGIVAGVFDMTIGWKVQEIAYIEFKGFSKAGKAGVLSRSQIDWGNRMTKYGHSVACFYDPFEAIDWLRDLGCPIRNTH